MEQNELTLISADNSEIKISLDSAKRSKFLFSKSSNKIINLPDIKGDTLNIVIEYLNRYTNQEPIDIPAQLSSNDLRQQVQSEWDYNLIKNLSFEQTFNLINAGTVLELEHLHDLGCAKIAAFMKGNSLEEINKEFKIECQLTADEAKNLGLDLE